MLPLGYVIGSQPFLGLKIHLDSKPLIPRPETEWWAEQLITSLFEREQVRREMGVGLGRAARSAPISRANSEHRLRFLDLCAGSGAIGCAALARLSNVHVSFGEIDPTHAATIRKNIRENGLDAVRADIRIGNLFKPFGDMKFDIIAANPPYIPEDRVLPESVADYESAQALRAGLDGLSLIRSIAEKLPERLTKDGTMWIECDSAHAEAARALFTAQGFAALIRTDQYGAPRIVVVSFP